MFRVSACICIVSKSISFAKSNIMIGYFHSKKKTHREYANCNLEIITSKNYTNVMFSPDI